MAAGADIRQYATAQPYEEATAERGLESKVPFVSAESSHDDNETRPAGSMRWGEAILGAFIAILPLYFAGFAIAAFIRDGTLASSFRNIAIFQMSKFVCQRRLLLRFVQRAHFFPEPDYLPDNLYSDLREVHQSAGKLEAGTWCNGWTHSASIGKSVLGIFGVHTHQARDCKPSGAFADHGLGDESTRRSAVLESCFKRDECHHDNAPFLYVSPSLSWDKRAMGGGNPSNDRAIENVFTTALLSPNSSKNGTQDVFGNIQIPLLEYLTLNNTGDSDGWLHTMDWNFKGVKAAIVHAAGIEATWTKPIYASIVGLPYKANLTSNAIDTNSTESEHNARLEQIKEDLFGNDAVNIQSQFSLETSYMYANCSTKPVAKGQVVTSDNAAKLRSASHFSNTTTGVANNANGFSISYDDRHSLNSTSARSIKVRSWLGLPDVKDLGDGAGSSEAREFISEAACTITQTYVEALVYCASQNNCTVAKIRESKTADKARPPLTALDGITFPASFFDQTDPASIEETRGLYASGIAKTFFDYFVNATTVRSEFQPDANLGPLESYFARPDAPFKASEGASGASSGDTGQRPITEIGDPLFSWRLSQLMNTYWLASVEPFSVISGIELEAVQYGETDPLPISQGQMYVERIVLRCHMSYFVVLLVISLGLCAIGMTTAYLDGTRRGPDVLDDFVNSLRHNPYVHVDSLGPSMQDGQEISRRLKSTVVQMGDVRPGDSVGYVAIGTPNDRQPVERLDPRRHYL